MAKPKPPPWLTQAFAEGVVELAPARPAPAYKGALGRCWLAQCDERQRPCSGRLERFHFIGRQRVENALRALLPPRRELPEGGIYPYSKAEVWDLILLAAWDPRNGGIGCEAHHRRFDGHLTPSLQIPYLALPSHVVEFAFNWGIEAQLERFPPVSDVGCPR
jgi:hypothetical protein